MTASPLIFMPPPAVETAEVNVAARLRPRGAAGISEMSGAELYHPGFRKMVVHRDPILYAQGLIEYRCSSRKNVYSRPAGAGAVARGRWWGRRAGVRETGDPENSVKVPARDTMFESPEPPADQFGCSSDQSTMRLIALPRTMRRQRSGPDPAFSQNEARL